MGRGGTIACPMCGSNRTKTARGRRAEASRVQPDGSILRGHKCEDCGQLFLSVQRALNAAEAAS